MILVGLLFVVFGQMGLYFVVFGQMRLYFVVFGQMGLYFVVFGQILFWEENACDFFVFCLIFVCGFFVVEWA